MGRMSDPFEVDALVSSSAPSGSRPASFTLSRGLPGRLTLTPPPGRLTSLRSRDLTLGGYKKKTFMPNVHSVRKLKDELKDTYAVPKRERREKDDRQRESRTRRKERPQTIQSHSIFEQGPADTTRKFGSWGSRDLSDCGPSLVTKSIKKERNVKENADDEILQKLQRDDFLDDPSLRTDDRHGPIHLPLHRLSSFLPKDHASSAKEEMTGYVGLQLHRTQHRRHQPQARGAPSPQPPTVGELFQQLSVSDSEEMLFVQLPDTIPGRPTISQIEKPSKKDGKSEDKCSSHIKRQMGKESMPVLLDFSEGLMGKLQIRKSGKVQLVLGDVTLDVSEGAAFSFLQQLVSIRLSDGPTGDMCVLGNVRHKLVCSPDFEALLQGVKPRSDAKTEQSDS